MAGLAGRVMAQHVTGYGETLLGYASASRGVFASATPSRADGAVLRDRRAARAAT
jgi:hypothetical protein